MLSINRGPVIALPRVAVWLIGVNVGVWVLLSLLSFTLSDRLFKALLQWVFELPALPSEFICRPWTIVSYAFTQISFLHLFLNCIVILWGTIVLTSVWVTERVVITYFAGAAGGGIAFMIASVFMSDEHELLIGASASAMALVGAVAVLLPNRQAMIFPGFNVRLLWVCVALIAMDVVLAVAPLNPARFAHLGGATAGALTAVIYNYIATRRTGKNQLSADIVRKVRQSGLSSLSEQERKKLFDFRGARKVK